VFSFGRILSYLKRVGRWHIFLLPPLVMSWIVAVLLAHGLSCTMAGCTLAGPISLLQFVLWLLPGLILAAIIIVAGAFIVSDFMRAIYGLQDVGEAESSLVRELFGTLSFRPYLIIQDGKVPSNDKDPLMRVGGPGNLVIYKDSAVVLEKAGKLTRVAKKGFVKLEDFERVWDVVDLRPHRWVFPVSAMSKEGIPVTCEADVTLQIDDGGKEPSEDEPFPATEKAIFIAATRKWMREAERSPDDQFFDWARRAIIGMTEGALRAILARYLFDQLLGGAESKNGGHFRAEILDDLKIQLEKQFPDLGAKLTKVALGDIKVDDKVAQQQVEAWQALWKRWIREREAEGKAARIQYEEAAKAQAQADMIIAITQAFKSLRVAGTVPSQLVLLRILEVLRRSSYDPQTGMLFLPAEVMRTWKMIQDIALSKKEGESETEYEHQ
jgi:regulator of protease activity HflC (stomatin/prohibitin superfamily)